MEPLPMMSVGRAASEHFRTTIPGFAIRAHRARTATIRLSLALHPTTPLVQPVQHVPLMRLYSCPAPHLIIFHAVRALPARTRMSTKPAPTVTHAMMATLHQLSAHQPPTECAPCAPRGPTATRPRLVLMMPAFPVRLPRVALESSRWTESISLPSMQQMGAPM